MPKHRFTAAKRHRGEHVAEWTIRIVASTSILTIFLIFVFVFRETTTLFSPDAQSPSTASSAAEDVLTPELYNADALTPEEAHELNIPEVYNPETGTLGEPEPIALGGTEAPGPAAKQEPERSVWNRLTDAAWQPVSSDPKFGIMPLLVGTAKTTLLAILLGAPLGILAAMYSAFFAPARVRNVLKPTIELLAGFPSVVIGFFCLTIVATLMQDLLGTEARLNAIVGGIGLSITVIPIVFSIAEESLSAVPKSLREASLALGGTEWQTAYRVMLPAAAPGVFAAVLLGIGRAFGETMIAIMATGNAPMLTAGIADPVRTVAATIGAEMGEVVWGSDHYGVLFLLGTILFVVSFGLNAVTELYVKQRLIRKFQGQ